MRDVTTRALLLATVAGTAAMCGEAGAQTLTWNNAAGGSVGVAGNWNPAQVPGPASTLVFNLAAAYGLTFPGAISSTSAMTFVRGTQTLMINGPHTTGLLTIGNTNGSTGTVNVTTGTLNTGDVEIGSVFGSAGVLNVNDDDAVVNCDQLSVASNTNQLCTVSVTSSGRIEASSVVIGDDNPAGEGRVTVSGRTAVFPPELSTLSVSGTMSVGRDGIGLLNVANGALVEVGTTLAVGQNLSAGGVSSDGTVRVGGTAFGFPSMLTVGGGVRVGRGASSASDTGRGLLEVNDGGVVTVAGSTIVGGSGLGSGVLRVTDGGQYETTGLTFGGSGDFQHLGGVVVVNGGSFTHDEPTLVVSGVADTLLVLQGLASPVTYSAATADGSAIVVGGAGTTIVRMKNGTQVSVPQGDIRIGEGTGQTGTLIIEEDASVSMSGSGEIFVGNLGDGGLAVLSRGTVECSGLFVSPGAGSGTVTVEDLGSVLRSTAASIQSGGTMTVLNDGRVELNGPFGNQLSIASGATLVVNGGSVIATQDVLLNGVLTMTEGRILAREFRRTVPVSVSGELRASILAGPSITATGTLTLGDSGPSGFAGTDLDVGRHRVRMADSDGVSLRIVTIAGGELLCTSGFRQPAGTSTSGFGVVIGDLQNNGTLNATGSGLTFRGMVSGVGQGMSGTKFTFASDGGFTGTGTIAARVQSDDGARMIFTGGVSTIGDGSTSGFVGGGDLDITGSLTINDSNGVILGSLTTLRGGTLRCGSTMTVGSTGAFHGSGIVDGDLSCSGTVSPGIAGGDETSLVAINGDYQQFSGASTGRLVIDIEGPSSADADRIFLRSGTADLRGVIEVRLLAGFSPTNGFRRSIVQAGSILFNPTAVVLPPRFHLEVTAGEVIAVFCSADFNEDGFVDFFDYDDFVECFETGACPAGATADFNEDDFVDFFDYDAFVSAFETGC